MQLDVMPIPAGLEASGAAVGTFEVVCGVADVAPGEMRRVTRGDLDLLIVNSEGGLLVTDDRCPHMSAPLSLGLLDGCTIACPLHSGTFDLCTGGVIQFPTTGGLDADGGYHAPWSPSNAPPRPEPTDSKARARAATRIRRLRYYPVRINGDQIEVRLPSG